MTELTELGDTVEMIFRKAVVQWHFGYALHRVTELCVLRRYFVPVFHKFVSCSVFRLAFSSSCYPSVDSSRVASLPGLGLIVFYVRLGLGGWRGYWKELMKLTVWEVTAK